MALGCPQMVIIAAERTHARLIAFADGKLIQDEDYRSVVQDIGAFGIFIAEMKELLAWNERGCPGGTVPWAWLEAAKSSSNLQKAPHET